MGKKIQTTSFNSTISRGEMRYVDIDIFRFQHDEITSEMTVLILNEDHYEFLEGLDVKESGDYLYTSEIEKYASNWIKENVEIVATIEELQDNVSHPSHYQNGGKEAIEIIKDATGDNFGGFLVGNIIKYISRYRYKNGVEDLKKAQFYLDRLIKEAEDK